MAGRNLFPQPTNEPVEAQPRRGRNLFPAAVSATAPQKENTFLGDVGDNAVDFAKATGHHLLTGAAGPGQLLINGANALTGNNLQGVTDYVNRGAQENERAYQADVPDSAASYTGAAVGDVLPYLVGGKWAPKAAETIGEGISSLASKIPGLKNNATAELAKRGAVSAVPIATIAPVNGEGDYWSQKGMQELLAPFIGAGLPPIVKGITGSAGWLGKQGADIIAGLFPSHGGASRIARDVVDQNIKPASPEELNAMITALRGGGTEYLAGAKPNAGQALAEAQLPVGSPQIGGGIIRLQSDLANAAEGRGAGLQSDINRQNAAMITPLRNAAGGDTRAAQDAAQKAALEERTKVAAGQIPGPEGTDASFGKPLERANVAGDLTPQYLKDLAALDASHTSALQNEGMLRTEGANIDRLAPSVREPVTASTGNYPTATVPDAGATLRARYHEGSDKFVPSGPHSEPRAGFKVETEAGRQANAAADDFAKVAIERRADYNAIQGQLDKMAANGMKPLRADRMLQEINSMASAPGERLKPLVQKVTSKFIKRIASVADENGVVDARDLASARALINQDIGKFMLKNPGADKKQAAGAAIAIKKQIDDAIESAGGQGWKNALSVFSRISDGIERKKLNQGLVDKLVNEKGKVTPDQFLNATGRGEEEFLRSQVSAPELHGLGERLGPEGSSHVGAVRNQLLRDAKMNEVGDLVAGTNIASQSGKEIPRIPFNLAPKVALINAVTSRLGGGAVTPVSSELTRLFQNPDMLANIIAGKSATGSELGIPLFMKKAINAATGQNAQRAALIETMRQQ